MTTLCPCALNGADPRDIDPAVILLDTREHPPAVDRRAMPLAGRDGARLTASRLTSLSVSVELELHEPDPARRKHLCGELARWASPGGWLTLGDRPGQRLRVSCDAPPVIASSLGWTQPVTVTFTAWDAPWWESDAPTTAQTPAARSGSAALRVPGDRPAPLEAAFTASGPVNTLTVTAAGQTLRMTDLALAPGETLLLTHDDRALTRLVIRDAVGHERSALHRRDPLSDDELMLTPRAGTTVAYTADGPAAATFSARGRWL